MTVAPHIVSSLPDVKRSDLRGSRPIIMLPGLLNTPAIWNDVISFQNEEFRQRCLPMACPPFDTVEAIADAVALEAPKRFHLIGYSFGGYVSLALLERHPERVASITLVGSASHADGEAMRAFRQQCLDLVEEGAFNAVAGRMTVNAMGKAANGRGTLFERALKMATEYGADRFTAHIRACMTRLDRTGIIATANIISHFISGEDDVIVPLKLQHRTAEAAGQSLQLIPKAGHLVLLEQPTLLGQKLSSIIAEADAA